MSFGMMRTNVGAKGKAQPHFNYIMALGRYAKKSDEIEYTENGNMPSWAKHNQPNYGNVPTCSSVKTDRLIVSTL